MRELLTWLNDQLLRMQWLSDLAAWILSDSADLFHFLRTKLFPPPLKGHASFSGSDEAWGQNTSAALLGTLTPFCSCSSIPLFIGFTSAGLPLSVTFSFLISSSLVDLASVILLASIFNWIVALSYVAVGLVLAGTLIGYLKLENQV